jgi:hypothetical protein
LKAEFKTGTGRDWEPSVPVPGTEWKPVPKDQHPVMAMTEQKGRPRDNEIADLTLKITDQGNVVRQLKSSGADKVSTLLVFL